MPMRKNISRLLGFLRDPAVQTVCAILGLAIVSGGAVLGWFNGLVIWIGQNMRWVAESRSWPNWLSLTIIGFLILFASLWLRSVIRDRSRKATPSSRITYHEIWGVLWGWPPRNGKYIGDGPLCPSHKLPVDINRRKPPRGEEFYEFRCPGHQGEEGHTIAGPKVSQLVGSSSGWRDGPNIFKDVNARLQAEDLARDSK